MAQNPLADSDLKLEEAEDNKEETKATKAVSLIWSWGKNKYGELSHGGTANALLPREVRGLKGKSVRWVSSGAQHSGVVTEAGELFVCGSYLHGKLGIEGLTKVNITTFQPVPGLSGLKVKQVECGDYHTLCLLDSGEVYTWGGSLHKKLGVRSGGKDFRSPAPVAGFQGVKIARVACGDFHSVVLTSEGRLFSWGGGGSFFNRGQCGHGNNKDSESPEMIVALEGKTIVDVVCGGYHTLALSSDNELYAWGSGLYGECGFGAFVHSNAPRLVSFTVPPSSPTKTPTFEAGGSIKGADAPQIKAIAAGGHHSMVLSEDGRLYTFGYSAHGQLGLHHTVNQCFPQFVRDFAAVPISQISAGWHHSLALTKNGDLYACGHGASGQLGLGSTEIVPYFVHVSALGPKDIRQIFAGGDHSWVVLDSHNPDRADYHPPSPLHVPPSVKSPTKSQPEGLNFEDYALLSGYNKEAKSHATYYLQVSYTDLALCHRFARFVVPERNQQNIREKAQEFVDELKGLESGVLYHRLQEDEDVVNEAKVVESPGKVKSGQYYTLCIVVDPGKNNPPVVAAEEAGEKAAVKEGLLGTVTSIPEETIKTEKGLDGKLSAWVKHFHRLMLPFCSEQPTFFELRPLIYKD